MSAKPTLSQQTASSTPQTNQAETDIRRTQLINALERAQSEVKASRKYIAGLEASIKSKQSVIDALGAKSDKQTEAIESLESELSLLKQATTEAKAALETRKQEVDFLKSELNKTREKLSHARNVQKYLIVAAVVAALIAIFR